MKNDLLIKRCKDCGALVHVIYDCNCSDCSIKCCGKSMEFLTPNTCDANKDKHIPKYEIVEDEIYVSIDHPMDNDHYIMWIAKVKNGREEIVYLYPEQEASCRFKYEKQSTIYAYCNKHQLWKSDIK